MKKILFVCSGNTCRSPMAEAVFNSRAEKENVDAKASSAGLYTTDGISYTDNAVKALAEIGIKVSGTSKCIDEKMLADCDAVFCMTYSLGKSMCDKFLKYADKIFVFPDEIPDPYGRDIVVYRDCLVKVQCGIDKILASLKENKL